METKNDIINQIQDLLGSGGDREAAEKVYDQLREEGRIHYTAGGGLEMDKDVDLIATAAKVLEAGTGPRFVGMSDVGGEQFATYRGLNLG
jgi:hypothetical protein